ncbi:MULTISPECIES: NYN domain-containing protein [unclassified Sphingomonas]|uniref:NYN domain-containing protein n=1 Tax=unclassified Sphingomonas TaxID=196159 RepID=UPI001D11A56F|nr:MULTISPECIES: NYN domain-containing protein [unclassified Sphingomonas]MCC2979548.1 NYN domain-containing protein [Sphingomonas sp. IC4-52]MCD2315223.1 NYN domain-containing protein [Sphingomonas sp. IC-11]
MASDDTPTRNIALLIDADNASWHAIDPVLTVLAELGTVNIRRVYGNWSKPALSGWRDMTIKHGIEPQQQFDITKGKNATDMKMTIDAMDLLFRGRVEGFGIMSSDSDFMPLATRLRQDGLPVYGFGQAKTPEGFKRACTRFIDVDKLMAAEEDAPKQPPSPAPTKELPAAPTSSKEPPAPQQPQPAVAAEPAPPEGPAPIDDELVKLLIDAYSAVKRDEKGFVSLSAMGQLAANRSSFDVRNYGYKRLSDLIAAVPNFQTERREDGRVFVRRLR